MKFFGTNLHSLGVRHAVACLILGTPLMAASAAAISACSGDEFSENCGGSGGSSDDDSGGTGGEANVQERAVDNCEMALTVGEVEEKIIKPDCAKAGCHVNSVFGDYRYKATGSAMLKFIDAKSKSTCIGEKVIDKANPNDSLFLRLLQADMPKCQDDSDATARMPRPPEDRLDAEKITCLEEYLKALTAD